MATSREFYHNESLGSSTYNTNTSYQDKVTLTFTAQESADYLIIASWSINENSTSYNAKAKLIRSSGTPKDFQEAIFRPTATTDYANGMAIAVESLTADTEYTYKVQYATSNTSGTVAIKNVSITAIKLTSDDKWTSAEGTSTNASTSFTDKCTKTFTPGSQGDYLIIGSAQLYESSTSGQERLDLDVDGTDYGENIFYCRNTAERTSAFAAYLVTLTAAEHTVKSKFRSNSASYTCTCAQAWLVALRLDGFPGMGYMQNADATTTTNNTTSYVEAADSLDLSSKDTTIHRLKIAWGRIGGSSTSYYYYGESYNFDSSSGEMEMSIRQPKNTGERFPFGAAICTTYDPNGTSVMNRIKSSSSPRTATIYGNRIFFLNLETLSGSTTKNLAYKVSTSATVNKTPVSGVITNGDFETGDTTGWTHTGGGESSECEIVVNNHSGTYSLWCYEEDPSPGGATQDIDLTDVNSISFYYWIWDNGMNHIFSVYVDGTKLWSTSTETTEGWGYGEINVISYSGVKRVYFEISDGSLLLDDIIALNGVSLTYVVEPAGVPHTIQKTLGYKVSKATTKTPSITYKVLSIPSAITKDAAYNIKSYVLKVIDSIYKVATTQSLTPISEYIVTSSQSKTSTCEYCIITGSSTQKGIEYTVSSPSEITAETQYKVVASYTSQKSTTYDVISLPSAISKSLGYNIIYTQSVDKGAEYVISIPYTTSKDTAYVVTSSQSSYKEEEYLVLSSYQQSKDICYTLVSSSLRDVDTEYYVNVVTDIPKTSQYCVLSPQLVQKTSEYEAILPVEERTIDKNTQYTIITQSSTDKNTQYYVNSGYSSDIDTQYTVLSYINKTKDSKYTVLQSILYTRDVEYAVDTTNSLDKSTEYYVSYGVISQLPTTYSILAQYTSQKPSIYTIISSKDTSKGIEYLVSTLYSIQTQITYNVSYQSTTQIPTSYYVISSLPINGVVEYTVLTIQPTKFIDIEYIVNTLHTVDKNTTYYVTSSNTIQKSVSYVVTILSAPVIDAYQDVADIKIGWS
jgi:hypothetical protein